MQQRLVSIMITAFVLGLGSNVCGAGRHIVAKWRGLARELSRHQTEVATVTKPSKSVVVVDSASIGMLRGSSRQVDRLQGIMTRLDNLATDTVHTDEFLRYIKVVISR